MLLWDVLYGQYTQTTITTAERIHKLLFETEWQRKWQVSPDVTCIWILWVNLQITEPHHVCSAGLSPVHNNTSQTTDALFSFMLFKLLTVGFVYWRQWSESLNRYARFYPGANIVLFSSGPCVRKRTVVNPDNWWSGTIYNPGRSLMFSGHDVKRNICSTDLTCGVRISERNLEWWWYFKCLSSGVQLTFLAVWMGFNLNVLIERWFNEL